MYDIKMRKLNQPMKRISPSELIDSMNRTDEVIVNRVTINVRILEIQRSKKPNLKALSILSDATERIISTEHNRSGALFGAKMSVKDVILAFGGETCVRQLPYNTFVEK